MIARPILAQALRTVEQNRVVLTATGSLVAAWGANSLLGFVFWWLASRQFSPAGVGLAGATVSASILIGRLTVSGLGTSLAGFMPTYVGSRSALVATGIIIAAGIGAGLGLAFAVIAPAVSAEYLPLWADPFFVVLFVIGAGLTSVGVVLDQILLSLRRANLQLLRNVTFAASKVGFLIVAAQLLGDASPIVIFGVWALGDAASLLLLLVIRRTTGSTAPIGFAFRVVLDLARNAFGHHAISSMRHGPGLFMPVLVTGLLTASANAAFYVALILTTSLQIVASMATFTLFAVGEHGPRAFRHQLRLTLAISTGMVLAGMVVISVFGTWFLSLFGPTYVNDAAASLPWLAACAIPLVVIDHWIALRRIRAEARGTVTLLAVSATVQVVAAAIGAVSFGITGLAVGWFLALSITALLLIRELVMAVTGEPGPHLVRWTAPGADTTETKVEHAIDGGGGLIKYSGGSNGAVASPDDSGPGPSTVHISLCIPIHNDARWVAGAIDAVLAQTHPRWDLVIGDNASTDDLAAVVAGYDDARIRCHRFNEKVSILESWNRTAALCTGPWIQPLAADDRIRPDCLARLAAAIEEGERESSNSNVVLAISSCRRVYQDGRSADRVWYGSKRKLPVRNGRYTPVEWMELCTSDGQPPWNIGSVAVRRAVLQASGGLLRPEIGLSADFEAAMRIGAYGDVVYITDELLDFTVRDDSDGPARLRFNRARSVGDTVVGFAFQNALRVHEEVRGIDDAERRRIVDAIARSHLQRAGQHRVLPEGKGRSGAAHDVLRALRWSRRVALRPASIVYAFGVILAPRRLLEKAKDCVTDRHNRAG